MELEPGELDRGRKSYESRSPVMDAQTRLSSLALGSMASVTRREQRFCGNCFTSSSPSPIWVLLRAWSMSRSGMIVTVVELRLEDSQACVYFCTYLMRTISPYQLKLRRGVGMHTSCCTETKYHDHVFCAVSKSDGVGDVSGSSPPQRSAADPRTVPC